MRSSWTISILNLLNFFKRSRVLGYVLLGLLDVGSGCFGEVGNLITQRLDVQRCIVDWVNRTSGQRQGSTENQVRIIFFMGTYIPKLCFSQATT